LRLQPEFAQGSDIQVRRRIFRREKLVTVKNRIRAGEKAERLTFA